MDELAKTLLDKLSLEEKVSLLEGEDFWNTRSLPEKSVPSFCVSDGPSGLRKMETGDGMGIAKKATCFPCPANLGNSFDKDLARLVGRAISLEAKNSGVDTLLAPGANIKRNPLGGRSFEYLSEDPYLSGILAGSYIRGVQSTGIGACLKHFAANSQEYRRHNSDSIVDMRALHEIYLRQFEIAIKTGEPRAIMCSYNKINGSYASDNEYLLKEVLFKQWGYQGYVMTDWGALGDKELALKAGCILSMPGGSHYQEKKLVEDIKLGKFEESYVDKAALRIIGESLYLSKSRNDPIECDYDEHHRLAVRAASASAVLLKNDGLLPLNSFDDCLFVGSLWKKPRYQGGGSSNVNAKKLSIPLDEVGEVSYVRGYKDNGDTDDRLIEEALEEASKHEKVILMIGLPEAYESEGFDRKDMRLPKGQLRLIERLAKVNPNIVAILISGSPVELPFIEDVSSLLYMGLPGEGIGEAIKQLLLGVYSPSGRLSESWMKKTEDLISLPYFGKDVISPYAESLYVGYRYCLSADVEPRFPFGYGLSYASFEYESMRIDGDKVYVTISNTSRVSGNEIVQVYVDNPQDGVYRPKRELRGFTKVFLSPGEKKEVEIQLDDRSFMVYQDGWRSVKGTYTVGAGSSSADIHLSQKIKVKGEELSDEAPEWYHHPNGVPSLDDFEKLLGRKLPVYEAKKGSFTMDNSLSELAKASFTCKAFKWAMGIALRMMFKGPGKANMDNPNYRMTVEGSMNSSMRMLKISGRLNNQMVEGLIEIANGHLGKGLKMFGKKG
ncbi:MAG: glycoside hydrolase family 3 C-terminal domain-containing protein [Bacillota bacterium]|nr:glycoside hydrolase family 3 C-terminal domain-containing protein [Bacillota bacterium]